MKRVRVLNGEFDPLTMAMTINAIFRLIESRTSGWIATVNTAILMMMREDKQLQNYVDRATIVVADGQPLLWYARWRGDPLPERVAGVDLVCALCERSAREDRKVYLLGATVGVVSEVKRRMEILYPGLRIDCDDGYFDSADARVRAERVKSSGSDILIVGMGVPRQENFIQDYFSDFGVSVAIGVGGSFDVLAGIRRRAPMWVQKIGLEWLFRLAQEPRRLFGRYLVTNSIFLLLVARSILIKADVE